MNGQYLLRSPGRWLLRAFDAWLVVGALWFVAEVVCKALAG